MNKNQIENIAMELIINAGIAKSNSLEALRLAKQKNYVKANLLLEAGKESLIKANQLHFEIIQNEANGNKLDFSLLLMHAEDQMINSQTCLELVEGILDLLK